MLVRLLVALLPVLLGLLWLPQSYPSDSIFSLSSNSGRILLVTAHPDDECMFFAPTLLALVARPKIKVHSLCLSNGNQDSLGDVRERELMGSLDVLGVSEERRWIMDHPQLQDNITVDWDPILIASVVEPYVTDYGIDTILTFDDHGVSSHPNHISLTHGLASVLTSVNEKQSKSAMKGLRVFTLTTVPLLAKYTGPFSALASKIEFLFLSIVATGSSTTTSGQLVGSASPSFTSGVMGYGKALKAMLRHQSQLVWFRWLYVSFSRYMWVNDWEEMSVPAPTTTGEAHSVSFK